MLAGLILASLRTHPERCASLPAVAQSLPPRPPWAYSAPAHHNAQQEEMATWTFHLVIAILLFRSLDNTPTGASAGGEVTFKTQFLCTFETYQDFSSPPLLL